MIVSNRCINCSSLYGMDSDHKFLCITCRRHFCKHGVIHTAPFLQIILDELVLKLKLKSLLYMEMKNERL